MNRCLLTLLTFVALLPAGCGADDASTAGVNDTGFQDATATQDTSTPDSQTTDTTTSETASETASDAATDTREVEAPLTGFKEDPTYLVPGNIAAKTDVVAAGDLVAWVEGSASATTTPILVVWDVSTPSVGPRAFAPPTLLNPRALALSDAYLVYVDDRYGDPDIFAIDLTSGVEFSVVNRPGAQEAPAVLGSRVAWEDCTRCVTGDGVAGHEPNRELVERDLAGGGEIARTNDAVADRAPSYGLLADGRPALAWLSGRATLRLERLEAGVSATIDVDASLRVDQELGRVAIWKGLLAWRPSPLIVNPDSMIVNPDSMVPSDVFTSDPAAATAPAVALTVHAEIAARMELGPQAFGPRLAWLEIPPGVPATGRVMLTTGGEEPPSTIAFATGMSTFAMGRDFVVFSAPRPDNDGKEDVHVLPLDLP